MTQSEVLFSLSHNCSLANGHFVQIVHFQGKLLKVELWVSRASSLKSYDWSRRKKGQIRDHLAKKLSIAFTLVLFGLLLTSAESKGGFSDKQERGHRHAALSSGIVSAQVPVSADHFNQLNATDTACCYESLVRFKEDHRWTALRRLFRTPLWPTSAVWVREGATVGGWGSLDLQTTLRQPVCGGMPVPLSHPSTSTSLQGLHSTSDMKCGWWTFVYFKGSDLFIPKSLWGDFSLEICITALFIPAICGGNQSHKFLWESVWNAAAVQCHHFLSCSAAATPWWPPRYPI